VSTVLEVTAGSERLETVSVDVLVLPFFESDRPLRGPAAWADWRLCGLLSERLMQGGPAGALGDAVLLPSSGVFRTPRLLALGLGPRSVFSATALRAAAADALRRVRSLGAATAAFALPTESAWGLPAERAAEAWLEGLLAEPGPPLAVKLLVPPADAAGARRGLAAVAARLPDPAPARVVRAAPLATAGVPDDPRAPRAAAPDPRGP
jgi:hypothetical protein